MSIYEELMAALLRDLDEQTARRVCDRVRLILGGRRVYFPSRPDPDVRETDTTEDIRRRNNVTKRTAYRWRVKSWGL